MFLKLVILLAIACAVRASVIINVFEADGEASHSLRGHDGGGGCNYIACDQLCRRLGFKGGACVGDRCKCDNFAPITESKDDYSLSASCTSSICDPLCRRLGYKRGACVRHRCQCVNFTNLADNKADYSLDASCTFNTCNQGCRNVGFRGGECVGAKCKCDSFEPITIDGKDVKALFRSTEETKVFRKVDACDSKACDQLCRRLGFPGGACLGDKCFCHSSRQYQGKMLNALLKSTGEPGTSLDDDACDSTLCDEVCRHFGFPGGACIGDKCKYHSSTKDEDETEEVDNCDPIGCNIRCQEINYIGGECIKGDCWCF